MFNVIYNRNSLLNILFALKLMAVALEPSTTGLAVNGYYDRGSSCGDLHTLLSHSCASPIPVVSSEVGPSCLFYCNKNPSCLGITFDFNSNEIMCYQIQACSYDWDKTHCELSLDKSAPMFKRICLNNGELINRNGLKCQCNDGWIGDFCERRAKHCKELYEYKYPKNIITVRINYKSKLIKMRCRVRGNLYQTWLFSNNGKTNKSRSWNDYKHGFYEDDANFFIGLENIRALIQDEKDNSLTTYIRQTYQIDVRGGFQYESHDYYGFVLNDESKGYTYSYDRAEASGNGLTSEKCLDNKDGGVQFSTPDNDNDRDPDRNCAALSQVGWWFDTCAEPIKCNPLGWRAQVLPLPLTHAHFTLAGVDVNSNQFKTKWLKIEFKLTTKT